MRSSFARAIAALAAFSCAGTLSVAGPAHAEPVKLRLTYLMADLILPVLVARDAGDYERAGIDLEAIEGQSGPAVVAALASGEADLGYSGSIPPINARLNGVPIKLVMTLGHEKAPDMMLTGFIATKASGITDIQGVRGHRIALNANGGLCELAWRDHLSAAGIKWSEVQPVVLPFPQVEAAMQQGAVDAACLINPFQASVMHNPEIGAKRIAAGMLADLSTPGLSDVIYTTDKYAAEHAETIRTFGEVTVAARQRLQADPDALIAAAEKYVGLTPQAAADVTLAVVRDDVGMDLTEVQKLLDAMSRAEMLSSPITAEDLAGTTAK